MAATVETARGPIRVDELGTTLMHEHVFVRTADVQDNHRTDWGDEDARVDDAVARLTELHATGVTTIVDPTVTGMGRDVHRIRRIADRVPLNLVLATGIYTYGDVPFYFRHRGPAVDPARPDPMVAMFVDDLTVGIAGTPVRAAILKCAIDRPGLTAGVERVLRAVGAAHRETGAPVMVHTAPRRHTGRIALEVLAEEGVDPARVILAHAGDSTDLEHLAALADTGATLGMDRFGIDSILGSPARTDTVAALCARGYAGSMVLSQDAACYIDWMDADVRAALPDWHYTHIHRDILPALRDRGVTDAQLTTMLVDVPRTVLSPAP